MLSGAVSDAPAWVGGTPGPGLCVSGPLLPESWPSELSPPRVLQHILSARPLATRVRGAASRRPRDASVSPAWALADARHLEVTTLRSPRQKPREEPRCSSASKEKHQRNSKVCRTQSGRGRGQLLAGRAGRRGRRTRLCTIGTCSAVPSSPFPILVFFCMFLLEMDKRVAARMTVLVVGRGAGARRAEAASRLLL